MRNFTFVFIAWASGGQKPQLWANFDYLGAPVPTPLTDEGQIWCAIADPRYTLACQISSGFGLFCRPLLAKNSNFCRFWTSAFNVVANWQQSDKVKHGYRTTNLPLSNGVKIVSVLQCLHGEIGRTISDVQKLDEQTNRQTDKKLNVFATLAADEIRVPPNFAW